MADERNAYRTQFPDPDWRQIAEQASKETDPRKLAFLIQALCDRLEEMQHARAAKPPGDELSSR
jgi:hypothetical protein